MAPSFYTYLSNTKRKEMKNIIQERSLGSNKKNVANYVKIEIEKLKLIKVTEC